MNKERKFMNNSLKKFFAKWIPTSIALGVIISLVACSDDAESKQETGSIKIYLTDAPAEYKAVIVYVKSVKTHYAEPDSAVSDTSDTNSSAWLELNTTSGYYNLLELRDSNTIEIVDDVVPEGKITQLRLILADSNYVVTAEDDTFKLKVPSGLQSGFKIFINDSISTNSLAGILIDFDAEKSIIQKGNGEYQLKPVLKAKTVN